MSFVPSFSGLTELTRSVDGPVAQHLERLVDRMVLEAEGTCPVAPPPEFPPGRWAHPPLHTTIIRSDVHAVEGGLVAIFGSMAPYAKSVHEGSPPHVIRARFAKALRFRGKSGAVVLRASVNHPGTVKAKANPWLLRAAHRILRG